MSSVYTVNFKGTKKKVTQQQMVNQQQDTDNDLSENSVVILATIAGLIFGPLVVLVAWNLCIPALFSLPGINYLQSLALYCLIKILK